MSTFQSILGGFGFGAKAVGSRISTQQVIAHVNKSREAMSQLTELQLHEKVNSLKHTLADQRLRRTLPKPSASLTKPPTEARAFAFMTTS